MGRIVSTINIHVFCKAKKPVIPQPQKNPQITLISKSKQTSINKNSVVDLFQDCTEVTKTDVEGVVGQLCFSFHENHVSLEILKINIHKSCLLGVIEPPPLISFSGRRRRRRRRRRQIVFDYIT